MAAKPPKKRDAYCVPKKFEYCVARALRKGADEFREAIESAIAAYGSPENNPVIVAWKEKVDFMEDLANKIEF
jgi:hypothetical protein